MKTPDEIKKALECCGADKPCGECPYRPEVDSCIGMITRDALDYIQQLESQVADLGKKGIRPVLHNGCNGCKWADRGEHDEPCVQCCGTQPRRLPDLWEDKND